MHHFDHRGREGDLAGRVEHGGGGEVLGHHHQGHVADHLGRRGDLDDVAEQVVGVAVGARHLVPAGVEAQRAGLLLEVGELAAGHLVQIHLGGAGLEVALEGGVLLAHGFPVEADPADRLGIEAGVALAVAQGLDDGAEAGLGGHARHGVHRRIHRIHAGVDGGQHGGGADARGVVGVQVHRHPDLLAQGLHQHAGGGGLEQAGHVLDGEDVAAGLLEFLRHLHVVIQ